MKAAALQMVSGRSVEDNLAAAARLIAQAARESAELVLLPENFAYFGGTKILALGQQEASPEGAIRQFLSQQAKEHGLVLIAGSLPTCEADDTGRKPDAGKVFTRSLVYGPKGEQLAGYNKIHLFDVDVDDAQGQYRESDHYSAGDSAMLVELPQANVGLSICYDLRYPELYRMLAEKGADILTVPAAFTYVTGEAHWQVLLRARAIENQCFVIAANQGGEHSESRKTWGHSCIISPWGGVLAEVDQGEGVALATLDFSEQRKLRTSMPVLQHRRL